MSVVTAVRNVCTLHIQSSIGLTLRNRIKFIRLLGGTLALAVGATIMYEHPSDLSYFTVVQQHVHCRNNSLRSSMVALGLPASTIEAIVNNPTLLADRLYSPNSASSNPLTALGITPALASRILGGYTHGFRIVFITNAALAACATLASIFMIQHKNLDRGDEQHLREKARAEIAQSAVSAPASAAAPLARSPEDIEMGVVVAAGPSDTKDPLPLLTEERLIEEVDRHGHESTA